MTEIKYKDLPSDTMTAKGPIEDAEGRFWMPVLIGTHLRMIETDQSGLFEIESD